MMLHLVPGAPKVGFALSLIVALSTLLAAAGCTVVKVNDPLTETSAVADLPGNGLAGHAPRAQRGVAPHGGDTVTRQKQRIRAGHTVPPEDGHA